MPYFEQGQYLTNLLNFDILDQNVREYRICVNTLELRIYASDY